MKKPATSMLICLCASQILWSENPPPQNPLKFPSGSAGASTSTLGVMAKYADVAGIGIVSPGTPPIPRKQDLILAHQNAYYHRIHEYFKIRDSLPHEEGNAYFKQLEDEGKFDYEIPPEYLEKPGYYIIRIEYPIIGCESNQEIRIERGIRDESNFPTNNACVVFAAIYYNYDDSGQEVLNWNVLHEDIPETLHNSPPKEPLPENPVYRIYIPQRTWWYLTKETQEQNDYFQNAVKFMRTERNWTNYYELCRSGLTSKVERISQDATTDIHRLFRSASDDQIQYMRNDLLLPQPIREGVYLNYLIENPDWRWP